MTPHNTPVAALTALILTACTTTPDPAAVTAADGRQDVHVTITAPAPMEQYTIRDTIAPDAPQHTRAALTANGKPLTDIYLMDYDKTTGALLQVLHQTSTAPDFAVPTLPLSYGAHTLRTIATRSTAPALLTADGTPWAVTANVPTLTDAATPAPALMASDKTSDTFAAAVDVTVAPGDSPSAALTLGRTVAQLVVRATDTYPTDCATLALSLTEYAHLRTADLYVIDPQKNHRISNVASLAGKTGPTVSYFLLCPPEGYTTDITITPAAADGTPYTAVTVANVPLARNKVTTVTGPLFTHTAAPSITINDQWSADTLAVTF